MFPEESKPVGSVPQENPLNKVNAPIITKKAGRYRYQTLMNYFREN
jgi:hypothetical protein